MQTISCTWIVANDTDYYPYINYFDTYEEAKAYFDEYKGSCQLTLAEVKEMK